jgi:hypothetical protein
VSFLVAPFEAVLVLDLPTGGKFNFCSAFTSGPGIDTSMQGKAKGTITEKSGLYSRLPHGIQTEWKTHPSSCTEDTYPLVSLEVNWPGREADHSPAFSDELKTSAPPSWRLK